MTLELHSLFEKQISSVGQSDRQRINQLWEEAHSRMTHQYYVALIETILVWSVFFATVVGALIGFFTGNGTWGVIFGSVSVIDLFGGVIFWRPQKQLKTITKALTLLDLHLYVVLDALKVCSKLDIPQRLECTKKAVDEFQRDLQKL
jgi:hypothetical protein